MAISTWAAVVQVVVSALSVAGGAAIAVLWLRAPQRGHLRQKLVLGLGLTDFAQGVTTLVGSALQLANHPYQTNSPSCNASGFVYQACVVASACWTLAIAITTYATLMHPFSRLTALLDTRTAFPITAAVIFVVSITPGIPITKLYDMINAGGLCWLESGTRRANLTLFIPRATTLLLVICLYTRLFIFFRRRDTGLLDTSWDEEDAPELQAGRRRSGANVSARLGSWHPRRSSDTLHPSPSEHTPSTPLAVIPGSLVQVNDSSPMRSVPDHGADLESGDGKPSAALKSPQNNSPLLGDMRDDRHHSFTVSFSGLDGTDLLSSAGSTPDLASGGGSSGPSSGAGGAATRPKRLSSGGFPARLSMSSARSGGPSGERNRGLGRGLSPRQLNKRLSLLMAVFPLAYAALVAVSIARLIQELSTNAKAPTGLLYTARFLIMSQGAIDGLLFVFVQAAFRWWCRRDSEPAC
ncbi:hypothetical protein JCM3770_004133 [Rhodotorula araucariae]